MADNRTWLQRQRARWSPPIRMGTTVTVGGDGGWVVKGIDYANRRYRVVKGEVDTMADAADVAAG